MNASLKNVPRFVCESCDYKCYKQSVFNKHLSTDKHTNIAKNVPKFICKPCDYICCKEYLLTRHLSTRKHQKRCATSQEISTRECNKCKKIYSSNRSYWAHSKNCSGNVPNVPDLADIINRLLIENQELRTFVMNQSNTVLEHTNEVMKQIMTIQPATVINNTNNNNKFNINVFLNEQCKDAINFADFVKSIEVSQTDLHNTGQLGFVDGISKIILDNLKQLSINERPIHCTDIKRETMYIKDEDKWNKEEDDTKLHGAIQTVSRKSMKTLIEWKQVNPDYEDGDSEFSQECLSMQRHSVAGDEREVYYPKVARLVAKEVIVDKS